MKNDSHKKLVQVAAIVTLMCSDLPPEMRTISYLRMAPL
jgi:hypothetical protein